MKFIQTYTLHIVTPQSKSLTKPRRTGRRNRPQLPNRHSPPCYPSAQTATDYDSDDDGYIDVDSLVKLNAIRYDLNGNGARGTVSVSDWANYTTAFPNAASGMGCSSTGCVGYELITSLNFDSDSNTLTRVAVARNLAGGVTGDDCAVIGPHQNAGITGCCDIGVGYAQCFYASAGGGKAKQPSEICGTAGDEQVVYGVSIAFETA